MPQTLPSAQGPQEPPQSTSVSVPFFTVSPHSAPDAGVGLADLARAVRVAWVAVLHSTHLLAPSQSLASALPGSVQALPADSGVWTSSPALQLSAVQALLSSLTSALSSLEPGPPLPSQTAVLQSPVVWLARGVSLATFSVPQVLSALQMALTHSLPVAGQSLAGSVHIGSRRRCRPSAGGGGPPPPPWRSCVFLSLLPCPARPARPWTALLADRAPVQLSSQRHSSEHHHPQAEADASSPPPQNEACSRARVTLIRVDARSAPSDADDPYPKDDSRRR